MSNHREPSPHNDLGALQNERRRLAGLAHNFAQQRPDVYGGFWFPDDKSPNVIVGVAVNPGTIGAPPAKEMTFVRVPHTESELRAAENAVDNALGDLLDVIEFYDQRIDARQSKMVVEFISTDARRISSALEPWSDKVLLVDLGANGPETIARTFEFWTVAQDALELTLHWRPAEGIAQVSFQETSTAIHIEISELVYPHGAAPAVDAPAAIAIRLQSPVGARRVVDGFDGEAKPSRPAHRPWGPPEA